MGGDVWQWNETAVTDSLRGLRGGSWNYDSNGLGSFNRSSDFPTLGYSDEGFRVASVPEPGSIPLLAAGAIAGLIYWRRWK